MKPPVTVNHNVAAHTYESSADGHRAVCDYELTDGKMVFTHTFVPPELRGRGIAEALVATAIGLFAAIPAVLAYNRFSHDIDRLATRFESFMEEFSNILQRQMR